MKKLLVKLTLVFIVFMTIIGVFLFKDGYSLYRAATSEIGVQEKINSIRSSEDYTTIDGISKDFLDAIVSVEDHRFYNHNGIDLIAIGRSVISNIDAGKIVMGGSTITQQLAKNLFFTHEQKLERKIAEVFVVRELEKNYSKKEILELYVNVIYYGDGYSGIKQASRGYFNTSPSEITLSQSLLLAGLPQSPENYALSKNYEKAKKRSEIVLMSMIRNNVISREKVELLCNGNVEENLDKAILVSETIN
ncbi:biosynthetic peptidoglycan transglycosylase [Clostridium sp.]|uniref:biosynthetic peptidoglycan transglycosylase n=1 Tax=Clostridium sp. TaxID=1506 RepID=UPI0032162FDF